MNKDILREPLNIKHIKERREGYGNVGYITASHAIGEANRAFDFEWSCETLEMKNIQAEQKPKAKDPKTMLNYIGYTCKVRVTVKDLVREGFGFGQGIDKDLGKAHESAVKEAESDALKRALRSFGNIFGLALYEKEKGNITNQDEIEYQPISSEQLLELKRLIQLAKVEESEIATFMRVEQLKNIKGADYAKAAKVLNAKIEKNKKDNKDG